MGSKEAGHFECFSFKNFPFKLPSDNRILVILLMMDLSCCLQSILEFFEKVTKFYYEVNCYLKVILNHSHKITPWFAWVSINNPFTSFFFNWSLLQPDGTDLFDFVHGHQTWTGYLAHMEQDGAWGDHMILCAAANYFETCICVVSSLSHSNDVIITPHCPVDKSKPLVLGHIHEVHYVSLQPMQGSAHYITPI